MMKKCLTFFGALRILWNGIVVLVFDHYNGGMTLQELLEQYGIHRPADLAAAAEIDRRHAWAIWHGERRIGAKIALRLYRRLGIPLADLLQSPVEERQVPKGRPPKPRPPEPPPEEDQP
jgi:transcriptional regulator with XRE-family HTH domain